MAQQHVLLSEEDHSTYIGQLEVSTKHIALSPTSTKTEDVVPTPSFSDHDSDSDIDVSTVHSTKQSPLRDVIESMEVILHQILSTADCGHLRRHSKLLIDLVRTHFPSSTDPELLSLLFMATDLLMANKVEMRLLCWNRIATLSLLHRPKKSIPTVSTMDAPLWSLHRKSLRTLTTMALGDRHLLIPLLHEPFTQHISSNDTHFAVRSGAILQIAKLFGTKRKKLMMTENESDDADRRMLDEAEEHWKQTLFGILCDVDSEWTQNAMVIQNVLYTLSEMARRSDCGSLLKYGGISLQTQRVTVDKLLHIIESATDHFAVNAILDFLHRQLLSRRLGAAYIESAAQHIASWIRFKCRACSCSDCSCSDCLGSGTAVNVLSAIKTLTRCLGIL